MAQWGKKDVRSFEEFQLFYTAPHDGMKEAQSTKATSDVLMKGEASPCLLWLSGLDIIWKIEGSPQ